MRTSECTVIKEVPETINLKVPEERNKLASLGETIASKEGLHYEGYIAYTDIPYSIEHAKLTLFFD
ncbi:MAG: hypothetical protein U9R38_07645 [Candidatus Margulisiibacteriota bacterium]|nr:hypothetical protein [Candidatus Margulisiibacteriota bacterium]